MAYQERDAYAVVLGKVIAYLRQKRGWTQGQLAEKVGFQQSTISRIENGSLTPDSFTLRTLAEVFGMTSDELQHRVEAAYARTQQTAASATQTSSETPWWQVAFKIAGIVGLAGLAVFAVAAIFEELEEKEPNQRGRRR